MKTAYSSLLLVIFSLSSFAQAKLEVSYKGEPIEGNEVTLDTTVISSDPQFLLTLSNTGDQDLTLSHYDGSGLVFLDTPQSIAPGTSQDLSFTFSEGLRVGSSRLTLFVDTNDPDLGRLDLDLLVVILSPGINITYRDFNKASLNADFYGDTLDFGINLRGADSRLTLRISNPATDTDLYMMRPVVSPDVNFSLLEDTLAPGQESEFESFWIQHNTSGNFLDTLSIGTNRDSRNPYQFFIKRQVIDSSAVLEFGWQRRAPFTPDNSGSASSDFTVEPGDTAVIGLYLDNEGNQKLTLSKVALSEPFFFEEDFITELDSGADAYFFDILAVSDEEGNIRGELSFETNDPNIPVFTLSLRSKFEIFRPDLIPYRLLPNGNKTFLFSNNVIDLGRLPIGSTASIPLELDNSQGLNDLLITLLPSESDVQVEGLDTLIPKERFSRPTFRFPVVDTGAFQQQITLVTNDASYDTLTLLLEGEGIDYPLAVSGLGQAIDYQGAVDVPATLLNTPLELALTVTNTSETTLYFQDSLGLPLGVTQNGPLADSLTGGQSTELSLQIAADTAGTRAYRVGINLSGDSLPPFVFTLHSYVDRVLTGEAHALSELTSQLPSSLKFVDVDEDGDLDIIGGTFANTLFYARNEEGTYVQRTHPNDNPFARFRIPNEAAMSADFLDYDADGDQDLLVFYGNNFFANSLLVNDSQGTNFLLFENQNGEYHQIDQLENPFSLQARFPGSTFLFGYGAQATMKVADMDADADDDIFLWYNNGFASIFDNEAGSYEFKFSNFPQLRSFVQYSTFGDLDLDGDLDVLVGGQSGRIQILENQPDTVIISAHRALPANIFEGGETQLVVPIPALVDIDNDQDLDLFTVANSTLGTLFFENTGVANLMVLENTALASRDTLLLGDSAVAY
ncbi:MAG TPA: hypothetical protein DCP28_26995, partial [Cytophagales bacterium]|nr:hypothetical protein [Cytophagales bacterium]